MLQLHVDERDREGSLGAAQAHPGAADGSDGGDEEGQEVETKAEAATRHPVDVDLVTPQLVIDSSVSLRRILY